MQIEPGTPPSDHSSHSAPLEESERKTAIVPTQTKTSPGQSFLQSLRDNSFSYLSKVTSYINPKKYQPILAESRLYKLANRVAVKLHLVKVDEGDHVARQLLTTSEFISDKDKITAHYEKQLNLLYTDDQTGHLVTKKGHFNLGISHVELLKTIQVANKAFMSEEFFTTFQSPKGNHFAAVIISNEMRLIKFDKRLGEGSYGVVYKAIDMDAGTLQAIKITKPMNYQVHGNEVHILRKINASGQKIGLQPMPTEVFNILFKEEFGFGIMGKYYSETDYETLNLKTRANLINDFDMPSQNQIVDECYQLVMGLKQLVDLNILNLDIKSQNVLANKESDDQYSVVIGDFGSAIDLDQVDKHALITDASEAAFTTSTTCLEDLNKAKEISNKYQEAFQNKNRQRMDELAAENYELRQAQMIFQLGTILHEAFTYETPYPMLEIVDEEDRKSKYPDTSKEYRKIPGGKAPQEVREVIAKMLDPDYKKRPDVSSVLAVFEKNSAMRI